MVTIRPRSAFIRNCNIRAIPTSKSSKVARIPSTSTDDALGAQASLPARHHLRANYWKTAPYDAAGKDACAPRILSTVLQRYSLPNSAARVMRPLLADREFADLETATWGRDHPRSGL